MNKKIFAFGDDKIEKYSKYPIDTFIVDIHKIMVSKQVSFGKKGFKYLIGYKDDETYKPLPIMLPNMRGCAKSFDETKYVSFY